MKCIRHDCSNEIIQNPLGPKKKYCSEKCQIINYRKTHPEQHRKKDSKSYYANIAKKRESALNRGKKHAAILSDSYIIKRFRRTGIQNPTKEQIEEKRLTLKIKRTIKNINNEIRKTNTQ